MPRDTSIYTGQPTSYSGLGTALLQHFTRDKGTQVLSWNLADADTNITYRFNFKLIGHDTLEKILRFVEKYHGKVRVYPKEYTTVVEFNINKFTIIQYNKQKK